jgi:hypothetical protein
VRIETRWRATKPRTTTKAKPYEGKNKEQTLDTSDLLIENALHRRNGQDSSFSARLGGRADAKESKEENTQDYPEIARP